MSILPVAPAERLALERGHHSEPHRLLGLHAAAEKGREGVVARAFHPAAGACELVLADRVVELAREGRGGLFTAFLAGATTSLPYRVRFRFPGGDSWEREDPYRFLPTIGELDLHLFNEGTHRRPWHAFGARSLRVDGVEGIAFSTWAPNAEAVALVGDFTAWDGRVLPMRRLGASGTWELFVPGISTGDAYKFEILGRDGKRSQKADPWASWAEHPPRTASRVFDSRHEWQDGAWMERRRVSDARREPLHAYEVHLGSWKRDEATGRVLTYRELAPRLADHASALGFTHVQLMPIMEHPFDGSWGYQVTGYHAPTSRFGNPDDFRAFVDELHRRGIGVILDWVPAHFVKDEWALHRYDGSPLFEHAHPHRGEHPEWGTSIFNLSRHEVRCFLLGSALYWLEEMHVDGLRVDAVASMLYLDYSRKDGEWTPNEHGGNENIEAVEFLQSLNWVIGVEAPGCFTIAEESTAWPGVTARVEDGGLGFTFKWNMGWMHDTLAYFGRDPVHRPHHHDQLTFAMLYENHERFVNPLSHDEVVHGKGSLHARMPGDEWQKLANLRILYTYMMARPGKKLLFMGSELAPAHEWRHDAELPWAALLDPLRAGLSRCLASLGALYTATPALWRSDPDPSSFRWIDCHDAAHSVFSFERRSGEDHAVVVLNMTPVPRPRYRIGAPEGRSYGIALNSDAAEFGGSGWSTQQHVLAEAVPWQGRAHSFLLDLPPLSALVLVPEAQASVNEPLRKLAEAAGIESRYVDLGGTTRETSGAVRADLLRALGLDPDDIAGSTARLASVPQDIASLELACPSLADLRPGGRRAKGVTVNAWSLWRRKGWGAADLSDIASVAEWAAGRGADWLGLSPLHLLRLDGSSIAPYSPVSRRWLHPLLLDITEVPEWHESGVSRRLSSSLRIEDRLKALRASPRIEHRGVLALKMEVLAELHRVFLTHHEGRRTDRARAHEVFVEEQGAALRDLATFLTIDEDMRSKGLDGWRAWDEELRDPSSPAVERLRDSERCAFHAWVQFELDRQLAKTCRRAREAGMGIGLVVDLAVGTDPDGADTWRDASAFARGAGLGAPPDPLGPLGQAWGLAPLNPLALRSSGQAPWREILRAALRHAGALRIDHAFGIERGFWIPSGRPASEGAYVRMPREGMLRALAEEAREAKALVIGEDLGTPPPGFPDVMRRGGLVSTRLLVFERDAAGQFLPADAHGEHAMLAFATHDLPPLQGWMTGRDLHLREELGLFTGETSAATAWAERARDRESLLRLLRQEGLLDEGEAQSPASMARAVHALLLRTRAPMIAFQLDDLLGETEPVNLPGVASERWPSWSRRHRIPVDSLERDEFARDAWPA